MLIPVTVHSSARELALEVLDVGQGDATLLYAQCETCGWDSRRDPNGDKGLFEASVEPLENLMLLHPL